MKQLILIFVFGAAVSPAFSQGKKCPFQYKPIFYTQQYDKSSAKNVKESENAMDKQMAEFAKPKYHSIVYAKKPKHVAAPKSEDTSKL